MWDTCPCAPSPSYRPALGLCKKVIYNVNIKYKIDYGDWGEGIQIYSFSSDIPQHTETASDLQFNSEQFKKRKGSVLENDF